MTDGPSASPSTSVTPSDGGPPASPPDSAPQDAPPGLPAQAHPFPIAPGHKNQLEIGPRRRNVFRWYELKLVAAGAAGGGASAMNAERVFFLPEMDAKFPIKEGPPPLDWTGYHAGKHGVYERFKNLEGESVNLGEFFFGEKYRWVQSQYLNNPNELKTFTAEEFSKLLDRAYEDSQKQTENLSGIFDSDKYVQDIQTLFDKYKADPRSTVWQGKLMLKGGAIDDLQTNVDFEFKGFKYRIAVNAKTGRMLNFFRIMEKPQYGFMKFQEMVLKWKGRVTDVSVHCPEGSTVSIEISSNWTGLFKQGVKAGALTGGLVSAFFGAIDGFKKEGLVGAFKGLAIGGALGLAIGGGVGGIVAVLARIWPIVGKVAKIGGFVFTVIAILLDATETGLDPQEWAQWVKDKDGNQWGYRHIQKTGSIWSPEYVPHGICVRCTDGTIIEFGDDESGGEASYETRTPIFTYASDKRIRWHVIRTPEGSLMWWWQDLATQEEFAVAYDSEQTMRASLARKQEETAYRFVQTQN
jgi:hypothetical protein